VILENIILGACPDNRVKLKESLSMCNSIKEGSVLGRTVPSFVYT